MDRSAFTNSYNEHREKRNSSCLIQFEHIKLGMCVRCAKATVVL